jgi:serine/threonine protein kinase
MPVLQPPSRFVNLHFFDIRLPSGLPANRQTKMEENFECLELIGQGSFGSVHKVRHRRTGEVFVMKVMDVEDPAM